MGGETVCVTGASGFIGAHLVRALLEAGHTVVGTVRDADNDAKTAHLRSLPGADERLRLVSADLLAPPGAFDKAVAGCTYVLHSASPYAFSVKDPQADLVDPAVKGTHSVLHSCAVAGPPTLKRLVLTSSVAAITDEGDGGRVFTGADWNEKSSLKRLPYYFSKVQAERAAHAFVAADSGTWDLVVINPSAVIGPALSAKPINTSVDSFVVAPCNGNLPLIPDLTLGYVDVRDVADAHVAAMTTGTPSSRYICSAAAVPLADIVGQLEASGCTRERGFKLPRINATGGVVGGLLKGIASIVPGDVGYMMTALLGNPALYDATPSKKELGISYRDWRTTVTDTVRSQAKWGNVPSLD